MEKYDVVILLGAQVGISGIGKKEGEMILAFHTEMRARAAGIIYQQKMAQRLIVSGGYNIGVRYDLDISVPVFGTTSSDRKPDFSDEARIKARWYRSEASVMAELIRVRYCVPSEALILEEDSRTTKENANYCREIVERCGFKEVGLLTLLYHMERAMGDFREAGVDPRPLFAEDFLVLEDKSWVDRIVEYYSTSKGGRQWDTEKIKKLLFDNKSIGEMYEKR